MAKRLQNVKEMNEKRANGQPKEERIRESSDQSLTG
jgi:hypothetical protein